jgi:hypothetical protein
VTTCRFAHDDGVYILGALAPAERAEYERHLPACQSCRHSVARLAVLPGLLGRLDPERALAEVQVPASVLPRLLLAAATRRRTEGLRRRWYSVAAGVVAASLATVVGVGVHMADLRAAASSAASSPTPAAAPVAMTSMRPWLKSDLPVSAEIGLVPISNGTRVEMTCRYTDSDQTHQWTVRLVVFPRNGIGWEPVASWVANSGEEISLHGVTHLLPNQIGRVELQTENYLTLLVWEPPI